MEPNERALLKIAAAEDNVTVLGPYERFVIWVHGCCFNCPGCLAGEYKSGGYTQISAAALAQRVINSRCEGVTLSGGEPFLQARSLAGMIDIIKKERDIGVIAYSGFTIEELGASPERLALLERVDLLIDGRYERELDDGRAYIGSSNQRLICLSDRYKGVIGSYYDTKAPRRAEIKLYPDKSVLVGVPSRAALDTWNKLIEKSRGSEDVI